MKKVMLRGNEKYAITEHMPHKFEYGVWYHFVTPFDWHVFRFIKGSRYVSVYDDINDSKPVRIYSKMKFIREILIWAKSPPKAIIGSNFRDLVDRYY